MKLNTSSFALLATLLMSPLTHAELVVVMRAEDGVQQLSAAEVSRIFLDKHMQLPNGQRAIPVDQPKGALRDEFYEKFTGKKRAMISAFWAQRLFTGSGSPPAQKDSAQAVIEFVLRTPNAVGYIDKEMLTKQLRVVTKSP